MTAGASGEAVGTSGTAESTRSRKLGAGDGGRPQDIRNQRRGSLNIYQLGEVTVTNLKVSPLVPTLPISVRDTDKVARKQLQPSPNTSCHDKPTGLCWSSVQFWMPGGIKIWTGCQ